jgi:sec-independent protein translocase protein TatC
MALPMYIFYEVGIISAGFFKKRAAPEEQAEADPGAGARVPAGPVMSEDPYVSVPGSGRRG